MGGGPASADIVRSSCFVTFPEQTHAEPVPVDAWYLFAAGLTFLRRLARDRVGDEMRIALIMQMPGEEDGERRYVSVSNNGVLKRALQYTFDCPDTALVLHVIDVGRMCGQKRMHVRPEVNPNVSPEPVERMGLVFPILSVHGLETPTAVEVPSVRVTHESLYDQMSRSMFTYRKDASVRWHGRASLKQLDATETKLSQSAFVGKERASMRNGSKQEAMKCQGTTLQWRHQAGVPVARKALEDRLVAATHVEGAHLQRKQGEHETATTIPVATVVETDATIIPSDYVMLELQTGAGLPEGPSNTSSTYFISSRWVEQADEMSASMRFERPVARAPVPRVTGCVDSTRMTPDAPLEDSFVILERHGL